MEGNCNHVHGVDKYISLDEFERKAIEGKIKVAEFQKYLDKKRALHTTKALG